MIVDRALAERVLSVVDAGLTNGVGSPEPGKMCVEAAVNYACGLPHGDSPPCVNPAVRMVKIAMNDGGYWRGSDHRAAGMRRIAIAQLGSSGPEFSEAAFTAALHVAEEYTRERGLAMCAVGEDTVCCTCFGKAYNGQPETGAKVIEDALRAAGSPGIALMDELLGS